MCAPPQPPRGTCRSVLLAVACCISSIVAFPQSQPLQSNLDADRSLHSSRQGVGAVKEPRAVSEGEQGDRSVQEIRAEIARDGSSAAADARLGIALYRDQQPAQSLNAFSSLLKFRQPTAEELRFAGLDYVALGDLSDADKMLHASLRKRIDDWRTWRYLGGVQYSEEIVAEAAESFRECLKLDPHNALAADGLARSLLAQGKPDEARDSFVLAVTLNLQQRAPSFLPPLHFGTFLFKDHNLSGALEQLLLAARLESLDSETHETLSQVYRGMGDNAKALSEMLLASSLNPDRARLHFLLAQLYRNAGNYTEDQKEIARYVALSKQYPNDPDR